MQKTRKETGAYIASRIPKKLTFGCADFPRHKGVLTWSRRRFIRSKLCAFCLSRKTDRKGKSQRKTSRRTPILIVWCLIFGYTMDFWDDSIVYVCEKEKNNQLI